MMPPVTTGDDAKPPVCAVHAGVNVETLPRLMMNSSGWEPDRDASPRNWLKQPEATSDSRNRTHSNRGRVNAVLVPTRAPRQGPRERRLAEHPTSVNAPDGPRRSGS